MKGLPPDTRTMLCLAACHKGGLQGRGGVVFRICFSTTVRLKAEDTGSK